MPWKKANRELMQLLEASLQNYQTERKMMFGSVTCNIRSLDNVD